MDSSKKTQISDSAALYTPPSVVRISDLRKGDGQIAACESGSGDPICFNVGNNATNRCVTGNGGDSLPV